MQFVAAVPEWLKVEAYSNYLVFGFGLCVGIIGAFIRYFFRRRSKIEASRTRQGELFHYSPEIAAALSVRYRGNEVKELHGTELVFRNIGGDTLKDIHLNFVLVAEGELFKFLEFDADDKIDPVRRDSIQVVASPVINDEASVSVLIPYLNSFSEHADAVALKIYSDRSVKVAKVRGGGIGWSLRYVDKYGLWRLIDAKVINNGNFLDSAIWMARILVMRFKA